MNTNDLALFVLVAQMQSLTKAAGQRDISVAKASASIKRLEQQVGAELFVRSPRKLRLSSAGERFLSYCTDALECINSGLQELYQDKTELRGSLRLSLPSDLGRNIIVPFLDTFIEAHPSVSLNLTFSDELTDFYTESFDLAIRFGQPQDSSLVAFPLADLRVVTAASPAYLATKPLLTHPSQLIEHQCLLYRRQGKVFDTWQFYINQHLTPVNVRGSRISNDGDVVRYWAKEGKGIIYKNEIEMASELASGHLKEVLSSFSAPTRQLYLVCAGRKQVTPLVVKLRDDLREFLSTLSRSKKA